MADRRTLVLLSGTRADAAVWAEVRAALGADVQVLAPDLSEPISPDAEPYRLARSAEQVAHTLGALGSSAGTRSPVTLCGVGLGAMVALQLAADQPDLVDDLVLLTRQVQLTPVLLSLPAVVVQLLPAARVQRLGAGSAQVRALLDQVRPIDASPLAARVQTPALVLCGARDPINRRASATLARTLPHGELQLVPQAGSGWLQRTPGLLTEALRARLAG